MVMAIIMVGSRYRRKGKKTHIIAGYFSNVYTRMVQRVAPLTHSRIYAYGDDSDDDNGGDHELLPSNIEHALKGPPQKTL